MRAKRITPLLIGPANRFRKFKATSDSFRPSSVRKFIKAG
jgi:hypothetical protein